MRRLWPTLAAAAVLFAAASARAASPVPSAIDPAAPFVLTRLVYVIVPQPPAVRVEELVDGSVRGTSPLHGLTFDLPAGAIGVSVQGAPAATVAGGAVHVAGTLAPGATPQYAFDYTLSWDGGRLRLPVAYPCTALSVLLPHGQWRLAGAGFAPDGRVPLAGGVSVDSYTTLTPTAGADIAVTVRRVVPHALWAVPAAVAALAAAFVGWRRLGRQRAERARREGELVEAVARLDLARGRGDVDPAAYAARRRDLLDELEGPHGAG